jgi:hypothetical protein
MKKQLFATFGFMTLLAAAAAFAQGTAILQADIPFAFRVGTKTLPAGHYEVRRQAADSILSIRCYACKAAAMVPTTQVGGGLADAPEKGKLVFRRYDETYFLAKVWTPEYPRGRAIPMSKVERELSARTSSPSATVMVALAKQ